MAGVIPPAGDEPGTAEPPPVRRRTRWLRILVFPLVLAALAAFALLVLDTPLGHRLIADRIAAFAPTSGLRITVGRIEGSIFGKSRLSDVSLADPQGVFARVPEAELDWRLVNWISSGLDIRELTLRRGILLRIPKLKPGDPEAPILPDFDIRIDHLAIERLSVAKGVLGDARRVDLTAGVLIRSGRALIRGDGKLGGGDRLFALLDADPDRDRFDLKLDYAAPKGGLLAGLSGVQDGMQLAIGGKGSWRQWNGALLAQIAGKPVAALQLTNRAGTYGVLGLAWPEGRLSGIAARAAGRSVAISGHGKLANRIVDGAFGLMGEGLAVQGQGGVDLTGNRFIGLRLAAELRSPQAVIPGMGLEGARMTALLEGPFRSLTATHQLSVARLTSGSTQVQNLTQTGTASYNGTTWSVPLDASAARVITGDARLDGRLTNVRARGLLTLTGTRLSSDGLALTAPGSAARLTLRGDTARGGYALAGPAAVLGFPIPDIGSADADGRLTFAFGNAPWTLDATLSGKLARVDNATLTTLAGTGIRFGGHFKLSQSQPLLFEQATLSGTKLALGLAGRRMPDGRTTLSGRGKQVDYGPFTIQADVAGDGPHAVLVFADPLPAAGLKDVRVALSPIAQGFRIETRGDSTLGAFSGVLGLFAQSGGPTRIDIQKLEVSKTSITGRLALDRGFASGNLALSGGGVSGTIALSARDSGQGFTLALVANDASFGGAVPLTIANGRLDASGLLRKGHSTITGNLLGQGIGRGQLFIGRLAANAKLNDGQGQVTASLSGRRGSRFELQLLGDVAPQRVAVAAQGQFAGQRITMPRRAILTREAGGWRLAPTQIDFAGGRAIASGLSGTGASDLHLALANMPLSLADVLIADLGLGGKISGLVDYHQARGAPPTGDVKVQIASISRSGLVLTSRPADIALVGQLLPDRVEMRAIISEGGAVRGRLQGRIAGLARAGGLADRIQNGALFAQLRYAGPADVLWRLAALDSFDLTGPLSVAADITGSPADPSFRGSLAGRGLQLQSAITGTSITGLSAQGSFSGSRLVLTGFSGQTAGGGTVGGSGSFDFTGIGEHGPAIDLRLAAHSARLLARDDMGATVTGPLAIRSDGNGGVIAGRLAIDRASWQLGRGTAAEQLPNIRTQEINRLADQIAPRGEASPWRFLIDATGPGRVDVRGLGLDSEWSADIQLRGNTAYPVILGRADLVRGGYEFAGKRFELQRGRIVFDGSSPPNPRLDIIAEDQQSGLTARIAVTGTALRPLIAFSSTPALPDEELLSRLLFGQSITNISAPEALQLGAALASLRGGGGLDPINKLRRAVGLDRLRIVPADVATGRGTSVAAGKYITRRLYAEVISDGRGYNATQLEFRLTSWLSLLSAVSTIGRESINARISKDY
ncbi:MAG: translocation/assembly module TamB domain-containing protein [Novosphingobium sp.]